jgi:hypothetical protein
MADPPWAEDIELDFMATDILDRVERGGALLIEARAAWEAASKRRSLDRQTAACAATSRHESPRFCHVVDRFRGGGTTRAGQQDHEPFSEPGLHFQHLSTRE